MTPPAIVPSVSSTDPAAPSWCIVCVVSGNKKKLKKKGLIKASLKRDPVFFFFFNITLTHSDEQRQYQGRGLPMKNHDLISHYEEKLADADEGFPEQVFAFPKQVEAAAFPGEVPDSPEDDFRV